MDNTVDVTIPVEAEAAAVLADPHNRAVWVVWSAACYARDAVPALWRRPSPR
ncbi:MAG TPA: hypothetical protein VMB73_02905 [Acetobacteraceae bacterium]|nr:hypothetical protein [Acetobacteraceae bacterium]